MTIYRGNLLNATALATPGLYIQVIAPQLRNLNGVPTNVAGFVGVASWGPVNAPVDVSQLPDFVSIFGAPLIRKYDVGTALIASTAQGNAAAYKVVRVTDGTDKAAAFLIGAQADAGKTTGAVVTQGGTGYGTTATLTASAPDIAGGTQAVYTATLTGGVITAVTEATRGTGYINKPVITVTGAGSGAVVTANAVSAYDIAIVSKYTGIGGNGASLTLFDGAKADHYRAVVASPGVYPEAFNVSGTGATLWANIAAALNSGAGNGAASSLVKAVAGGGSGAPVLATTYALAGGSDGAAGVTDATLLGVDTATRTGMYALRNTPTSVAALVDVTDVTTFAAQIAFGTNEGVYMCLTGPQGQSITDAVAAKRTGGFDSEAFNLCLGDWPLIKDTYNNGVTRPVTPQAFKIGVLANLNPSESSLNKGLLGIVGTQRSASGLPYSDAELQTLALNSIDVITNPIPMGDVYGFRIGRNGSSNATTHGDNHTRMTNYIATTLNRGMGHVVGKKNTPTLRADSMTVLDGFCNTLYEAEMIKGWQIIYDPAKNDEQRESLGYLILGARVTYFAITEYFVIEVEGGQSVKITRSNAQAAA